MSTCSDPVITPDLLPLKLLDLSEWPDLASHVISESRQYIRDLIDAAEKDQTEVAYILGIDDERLHRLIAGEGDTREILAQVLAEANTSRSPFSG